MTNSMVPPLTWLGGAGAAIPSSSGRDKQSGVPGTGVLGSPFPPAPSLAILTARREPAFVAASLCVQGGGKREGEKKKAGEIETLLQGNLVSLVAPGGVLPRDYPHSVINI